MSQMTHFKTNIVFITLVTILFSTLPQSLSAQGEEKEIEKERFPIVKGEPPVQLVDPREPGYSKLLAKVTPAVVSVFPARLIAAGAAANPLDRFFGGPDADEPDPDAPEGAQQAPLERVQGVGSGVILSSDGWIITNSHVVHLANGQLADAVKVELSDRRQFAAKIIGADPLTDVALLKIEANDLPFLPVGDSDRTKIGDLVFAVGNPFKVGMTATMGMVSATRRSSIKINGSGGFHSFIQTDAAINPGNSGGALVDVSGRLIGINSAIYSKDRGNIGLGFAIPSQLARRVALGLAEDGKMVRGFFGLIVEEVDADIAEEKNLNAIAGALIAEVMDGGPADKAGLKAGDVVLLADMKAVDTREDLRLAMSFIKPGGLLQLDYFRDGQNFTTAVTALEVAAIDEDGNSEEFGIDRLPGVFVRFETKVLTITSIDDDSPFKKSLEPKMGILEINNTPIASMTDAVDALRKGVNKVKIMSGKNEKTLAVRIE